MGLADGSETAEDIANIWSEFAHFSGTTTTSLRAIEALLQKLVETQRQSSGGEAPGPPPAANPESTGGAAKGDGVGSASSAKGASGSAKKDKASQSSWKRSVSAAFGRGIEAAGNPLALQTRAAMDIEADLTTAVASAFGGDRFAEIVGAVKRNAGGTALQERMQDLTLQDTQGLAVNFARYGISADESFYKGYAQTFSKIRERENAELVKATKATNEALGANMTGVAGVTSDGLQQLQKIQETLQKAFDFFATRGSGKTPGTSE